MLTITNLISIKMMNRMKFTMLFAMLFCPIMLMAQKV